MFPQKATQTDTFFSVSLCMKKICSKVHLWFLLNTIEILTFTFLIEDTEFHTNFIVVEALCSMASNIQTLTQEVP